MGGGIALIQWLEREQIFPPARFDREAGFRPRTHGFADLEREFPAEQRFDDVREGLIDGLLAGDRDKRRVAEHDRPVRAIESDDRYGLGRRLDDLRENA